jgi:hypothetical protein
MTAEDFSKIAESWLNELQTDRFLPPLRKNNSTTFPLGENEIEGKILASGSEAHASTIAESVPSPEDIAAGQAAYPLIGIDVLAFYKSFRFKDAPPFAGTWGIFLIDAGIAAVSAEYESWCPSLQQAELRELAVKTLLAHENYHFWIDAWALGQEILPKERRIKRYEHYLQQVRALNSRKFDYEESLANHYAYRKLKSLQLSDGSKAWRLVRRLFENCPEPYGDFSYPPQERIRREGELAAAIVNGESPEVSGFTPQSGHWDSWRRDYERPTKIGVAGLSLRPPKASHPTAGCGNCPVYVVSINNYAAFTRFFQGPTLKEFRLFLENYLGGELIDRTNHDFYRIDNRARVKFPNPHAKEVKGYELKSVLRKAGMSSSEFVEARQVTD